MLERRIGDDMFFYVIRGRGEMTVEDRRHPLRPGICAHFPRKVRHGASHDPHRPLHLITFHYNATVMESLTLPELLGFPDFFRVGRDAFLDGAFHEAAAECERKSIGHERGLEALAMQIFLHLVRKERYREAMKLEYREARHQDLLRLQPALQRMRTDLAQPGAIDALARTTGLSTAQFRRVFVRGLRMTPIDYLRRLRATRACWLLRHTSRTIEAIASEVGYQETSFFARTFKKIMGISPGAYRKRSDLL